MNAQLNASLVNLLLGALLCIGCRANPADPHLKHTPEGAPCPASAKFDDGEDNNNQALVLEGRGGYWYTYADDAGSTIDPPPGATGGLFTFAQPGAHGSAFAARMKGSIANAPVVFAAMGVNFADPRGPYDASKYGGLSFWAKRGPASTPKVRFKIPDVATDPEGGICTACYNDFGIDLNLTQEWTQYTVPFGALKQERGWGSPHPRGIDTSQVYALHFQVNDKAKPYDIWVDEIAFTGCSAVPETAVK